MGNQIQCCKVLKYSYGICSTKYRNCTCKANTLCTGSGCSQNKSRCRIKKTLAVMLSDSKYVKTCLVRIFYSFKQLSQCICIINDFAAIATKHGGKTINSNFHFHFAPV